jgi:2-oxoglutarate ferredoxin oxidoreductase subunit alpha
MTEDTIIVGDENGVGEEYRNPPWKWFPLDLETIGKEAGGKLFANGALLGFAAECMGAEERSLKDILNHAFKGDSRKVDGNLTAASRGREAAREFMKKWDWSFPGARASGQPPGDGILDGATAVSLGALAGGCDFVASYPMSPSTGVLTFLAGQAERFDLVVEQAEDEIAAVNMGLGAWYGGARALATTSGGGFSLMQEGISLAGMIESPMVIHLAQRPGPATGLPTRTEQGDFNLALYSGHGEFPRLLFAPGSVEEAVRLATRSFYMADRYQVPVIIMTDQFLMDSHFTCERPELRVVPPDGFTVPSDESYRRYAWSEDGISPRALPGYGKGRVRLDSDEHDVHGFITEDFDTRKGMMDKRLRKEKGILEESWKPNLYGNPDADLLVVCWGSTLYPAREALEYMENRDLALLHFSQVYPLPEEWKSFLENRKSILAVEGNATGQFARYLEFRFEIMFDEVYLKYNGLPFSVEELYREFNDFTGGKE